MILRAIRLKNFRSVGGGTGAGIEVPLARINYLIGPNGAGKSNILAGLERIAEILTGRSYEPGQSDYFDRDASHEMELGATFELSDDERLQLLPAPAGTSAATSTEELSLHPVLRLVRYSVVFSSGKKQAEKISATVKDMSFHTLSEARRQGGRYIVEHMDLKAINLKDMSPPEPAVTEHSQFPSTQTFIKEFNASLWNTINQHFAGLRVLGTNRKIADAVPAREATDVSLDGSSLPAEMSGLGRNGQAAFDEYMGRITHGDPERIEPRLRGDHIVLETNEAGLARPGSHADLGSGQEQSLILAWQLRNAPPSIFIIREPELHLHAERQKQIRGVIRRADRGLQFVIETHSPVFLGTAEDENVLLATKSNGHTAVSKIAPENMNLIREELGISHADALYNTRVLFVEGESEFIAFPMLWKTLYQDSQPAPSFFSLGGSGNTKHLQLLLEYLRADDRHFFAILDQHNDARAHIRALQRDKLLGTNNCHFLAKSFEDEFTSAQLAGTIKKMTADEKTKLTIDPKYLDTARKKESAADILKRVWAVTEDSKFRKAQLARLLGRLPRNEIPPGIIEAFGLAANHFRNAEQAANNTPDEEPDGRNGGPS